MASASANRETGGVRAAFGPHREAVGELAGTFVLVFFGLGAVHVAVLTDGLVGLWQVAAVWGIAVGVAIYATAELSGAHLNPAITVALAAHRGFPWRKVGKYVLAQVAGAFLAATLLYLIFGGLIARFEHEQGITRGAAGSQRSAMVYGEYFPNPAMFEHTSKGSASLTSLQAMLAESAGTAMLAFVVFTASQPRGGHAPRKGIVAIMVGFGLAMIICVIAPLTQAGFNPARDFGPRLFSYMAGWGSVAIPGPRGGFFSVYVIAPAIGGLVGGGVHRLLASLASPVLPADDHPADEVVTANDFVPRPARERVAGVMTKAK